MRPANEAELSEMIRAAQAPLRIVGGGTRDIGKPVAGEALCLSGLSGITLYDPGALTVVVQAGTALSVLEVALAAEGQRLPFEPMDMRALTSADGAPTVGGMVAANASGPRRVQAGACRDSLIGVRFVDGAGNTVKNGGRVMKNVTGYDLVKLMAGSWGTLGVLSECAFKLLPVPEAEVTLLTEAGDAASAVGVMSRALGTPFEVNGAAWGRDGRVALRIEGFASQVSYRRAALIRALGGDWAVLEGAASKALWTRIRDVKDFADAPGDVWRISVRPSDAAEIVARAACPVILDWGGGLIWALSDEGTDLRARLGAIKGHATLIRASQATRAALPVFQPEAAPVAALAKGLRARFDPRGILNPGLMG
ncbi:MAG: FAD-binding protein [Rhodobacteraceae bacterium]|nr:MAG: FAD-binding protein [Paracoccaceae bacterium]